MKKSIAAVLLCLASNAMALDVCPALEFAELQSMSEEELKKLHGQYGDRMGQFGAEELVKCIRQLERISRVVRQKNPEAVINGIAVSPKRE